MAEQLLRQTQEQRLQMVLAPQLRQSLRLLQVPALELRTLVQEELQKNPALEEVIEAKEPIEVQGEEEAPEESTAEIDLREEFEILARLDEEWREYFRQSESVRGYNPELEEHRRFMFESLTRPESLQEHLLWQLSLTVQDDEERKIGELLIGSLDDNGYLSTSLEELAESTGYPVEKLEKVLRIIHEFDPVGVGARDLRECLLLQLRRLGKEDSLAAAIVRDHLRLIAAHKYPEIAKAMKADLKEVQNAAAFIATLEPRPARMFTGSETQYVLPEVVVRKVGDEYVVILNNDHVPHIRISKFYRRMLEDPKTPEHVKQYIREKVRAGAFLIKSIHQRQNTIYRIAREIVRIQREFLDNGVEYLKPLTMAQIAGVLGLHETTVSRAIANKYMQTPQGTFEMKYFFTPGYRTADGREVSNKTIKDAIARLIEQEDPASPLSDQAIARLLEKQGIKVARRTVAKYREEMKILPSHLRRSY